MANSACESPSGYWRSTAAIWASRATLCVVLLRLCGHLVETWLQHTPAACHVAVPPLDLGTLRRPAAAWTLAQRQAQLHQAVTLVTMLQTRLTPHLVTLDRPRRI